MQNKTMETEQRTFAGMKRTELEAYRRILHMQTIAIFAGDETKRDRHIRLVDAELAKRGIRMTF